MSNVGDSLIGSTMGYMLASAQEKNRKDKKTIEKAQKTIRSLREELAQRENEIKQISQQKQQMQTTIAGLREQMSSLQQAAHLKERSQIALHVRMVMHRENLAQEKVLKDAAVRLVSSKTGADTEVVEKWVEEITDSAQMQRIISQFEEEDRRIDPYIPTKGQRSELMDKNVKWVGSEFFDWAMDVDPGYIERRDKAKAKKKRQG